MAAYTGAWTRLTRPSVSVPIVAALDPGHSTPEADPNNPSGPHRWNQDGTAPTLDPSLASETAADPVLAPGGPVDMTPWNHQDGTGYGSGLDEVQAQAIRAVANQKDVGAPLAHTTQVAVIERDGTPHLAELADANGSVDSPETVKINQVTGVGSPYDPNARAGVRNTKRWYDRFIDMHMFVSHPQPDYPAVAYTPSQQPAGTSQYVSPYPTLINTSTPDQFVTPQERRTPPVLDTGNTTDGTETPVGSDLFGLPSWGL